MSIASKSGPVAYLTSEYPKVSHTFILREIEALRARGIEVITCSIRSPRDADSRGAAERAAAASTFYVIASAGRAPLAHLGLLLRAPRRWLRMAALAWRSRAPGARAALWQLFYFVEAGILADHLRRAGAVHLHNHFGNSSCMVAMLAAGLLDMPYSFTVHGPDEFFRPGELSLTAKIENARFVVAISHFCRSQLMLFSGPRHWDKIAIVHCGIEPERYGPKPGGNAGKHVLFIGRLDPVKGGRLLLAAFARAAASHPEARLTVVGDGPDRAALEAQAAELGLGAAVHFAGFRTQEEVVAHLAAADMLVLPSFAEGVPVVLMEAMAARLPTIASRVAGVPELVRDGETGFVVPPGDLDTLTDRLDRLLSDPDLCARMGAAGRAVVEADFVAADEAGKLAGLFRARQAG